MGGRDRLILIGRRPGVALPQLNSDSGFHGSASRTFPPIGQSGSPLVADSLIPDPSMLQPLQSPTRAKPRIRNIDPLLLEWVKSLPDEELEKLSSAQNFEWIPLGDGTLQRVEHFTQYPSTAFEFSGSKEEIFAGLCDGYGDIHSEIRDASQCHLESTTADGGLPKPLPASSELNPASSRIPEPLESPLFESALFSPSLTSHGLQPLYRGVNISKVKARNASPLQSVKQQQILFIDQKVVRNSTHRAILPKHEEYPTPIRREHNVKPTRRRFSEDGRKKVRQCDPVLEAYGLTREIDEWASVLKSATGSMMPGGWAEGSLLLEVKGGTNGPTLRFQLSRLQKPLDVDSTTNPGQACLKKFALKRGHKQIPIPEFDSFVDGLARKCTDQIYVYFLSSLIRNTMEYADRTNNELVRLALRYHFYCRLTRGFLHGVCYRGYSGGVGVGVWIRKMFKWDELSPELRTQLLEFVSTQTKDIEKELFTQIECQLGSRGQKAFIPSLLALGVLVDQMDRNIHEGCWLGYSSESLVRPCKAEALLDVPTEILEEALTSKASALGEMIVKFAMIINERVLSYEQARPTRKPPAEDAEFYLYLRDSLRGSRLHSPTTFLWRLLFPDEPKEPTSPSNPHLSLTRSRTEIPLKSILRLQDATKATEEDCGQSDLHSPRHSSLEHYLLQLDPLYDESHVWEGYWGKCERLKALSDGDNFLAGEV
ncbi:hypothetical protein FGG08_007073 [Glutinoglossum americanum]|uniref:Uncharacterized protein n=1 Tax=Glutinoglossum americanum TaxID=1670608 RepID=A0A9P8HV01_9PEZI|nr:hypothetical protein FGG08_007073 [Glutinoglossum americanum]